MTVDDVIAEGPKHVVDDVVALVALNEFDPMKKTAQKPLILIYGLRFGRLEDLSQSQVFISEFSLYSKFEYQMAAA